MFAPGSARKFIPDPDSVGVLVHASSGASRGPRTSRGVVLDAQGDDEDDGPLDDSVEAISRMLHEAADQMSPLSAEMSRISLNSSNTQTQRTSVGSSASLQIGLTTPSKKTSSGKSAAAMVTSAAKSVARMPISQRIHTFLSPDKDTIAHIVIPSPMELEGEEDDDDDEDAESGPRQQQQWGISPSPSKAKNKKRNRLARTPKVGAGSAAGVASAIMNAAAVGSPSLASPPAKFSRSAEIDA